MITCDAVASIASASARLTRPERSAMAARALALMAADDVRRHRLWTRGRISLCSPAGSKRAAAWETAQSISSCAPKSAAACTPSTL